VKRRDLLQKLKAAGLEFKEGGNHTKVLRGGIYVSAVPRHTEISEKLAKAIAKQSGID
jgi:mRNA interferase HicA